MDQPDLAKVSLAQLLIEQGVANDMAAAAKARQGEVKAELARRFGESAKRAIAQLGKDHGTASLPVQDGFKLKAELKQAVDWDSEKLMAIAQTLPWDRVNALFKIKFTMSETVYKGVSALSPELRSKIDEARTTKVSEPVITLIKEDA